MNRNLIRTAALSFTCFSALLLQACIGNVVIQARNGSLELNPRLRADMQSSSAMQDGLYFAHGVCPDATDHECRFISPLRGSMVDGLDANFFSRLRRSNYFWLEADGYAILSYEFIGKGMSVVEADEPANVIAGAGPNGVDIGTCFGFPALGPETRQAVPGMEEHAVTQATEFLAQFDVQVRECVASGSLTGVAEELTPQLDGCGDRSVRTFLNSPPPSPQTVPLCLVNVPASQLMSDVSYSLLPQVGAGVNLQENWPGLTLSPAAILPHLKTVPVGGVRTISRPLLRTGETRINDDESITHWFTWQVPLENDRWQENFSPNVVVSRARVRKGPWSPNGGNYINLEALEVGNVRCQVRVPSTNNIDFDIPMCDPAMEGEFRVTPGYSFNALTAGRVDDGRRLLWDARVRVPPTELEQTDRLFLELDLTAKAPVGTSGSGLTAAPAGRDLGQIRIDVPASSQPGFTLNNAGPLSAWVESVTLTGRDAAEFGVAEVLRTGAAPAATAAASASIAAPFIFLAGSSAQINVRPAFQSLGEKRATVEIRFHDVDGVTQTIAVGLEAHAVSPDIVMLPTTVHFNTQPGANGHAQAHRGAILINQGPIPFQRISTSLVGAHAGDFKVIYGAYDLSGHTNLSQPLTIGAGESESYWIGFYPKSPGDRDATLLIETSEGQMSVALRGHCTEHCDNPPPLQVAEPRYLPPAVSSRVPILRMKRPWKRSTTSTQVEKK